mgnify:CR=1 FL=1
MPYELTTFQVNTWFQQKRVLTLNILSPWLELHVIQKITTKISLQLQNLPSYTLGGSISHVPENSVPSRVSQSPVEIC